MIDSQMGFDARRLTYIINCFLSTCNTWLWNKLYKCCTALILHFCKHQQTVPQATEKQVKQSNLPSGRQGKSVLIFRVKTEVIFNHLLPGYTAVQHADFLFGPKPAIPWEPSKASLSKAEAMICDLPLSPLDPG